MPLNLPVILGSVRRDRIGIRVARFVVAALKARGHDVTLVDPIEHALPLLDRMYKEHPKGQAPENLERLAEIIRRADAYVVAARGAGEGDAVLIEEDLRCLIPRGC